MRKRRKTMAESEKYHARKFREIGMSVRACADYFDVSVATLMRGLSDMREKMGPEKFETRKQFAREGLRTRSDRAERASNT